MWIASRYEHGKRRYRLSSLVLAALLLIVVLASVITGLVFSGVFRGSPLPKAISEKIDYVVFIPSDPWMLQDDDITYNDQAKVLTINTAYNDKKLSISQQLTPAQFIDVPQFFPTLLEKLGQYDSFGTSNGTVYLTRPKEFKGKTQAVLNQNGTLLFAAPNKELSAKDWRQFFNNLEVIK